MIGAAMAELELERAAAHREAQNMMAETEAEKRHVRIRARFFDERLRVELTACHPYAAHDAARAQLPCQRARIDVGNRNDVVPDQVVAQRALRAPVARDR